MPLEGYLYPGVLVGAAGLQRDRPGRPVQQQDCHHLTITSVKAPSGHNFCALRPLAADARNAIEAAFGSYSGSWGAVSWGVCPARGRVCERGVSSLLGYLRHNLGIPVASKSVL